MPRKGSGYMSLTVSEQVYNHYRKDFDARKDELARKGVTSFAGYITSMLEEEMMKNEIFARMAPFLQEFGYDEGNNTIYIKDNRTRKIASVTFRNKELFCEEDDRNDCVHIGFAYGLPRVYAVMEKLGIKPPKVKA